MTTNAATPAAPPAVPGMIAATPPAPPSGEPVVPAPGTPATPGAPAAPALPAAPLALGEPPAPPALPAAPAEQAGKTITYEPTGDMALDMALSFIGKAGYGPDHPAVKAATKGDFGLLKAELATKDVKGWEAHIALGERAFADMNAKDQAKAAADRAAIFGVVGGEDKWAAIQTWATANADGPGEKESVNAALAAGGVQAKAMALYLSQLYDKATGVVVNPASVAAPGAAGKPASSGLLDARAYALEVAALRRRIGPIDGTPEYAALQARLRVTR